jgi:hypothetical protein
MHVAGAQGVTEAPRQPEFVDDEVVVVGKALEELRLRIELAENDVYARFNEINSNDLFDVHCYERAQAGSRIESRRCLSNGWREADIAFADATVRDMQSAASGVAGADPAVPPPGMGAGYSHVPQQYRAKQLRTEGLVVEEMQRLAREDPELRAAMIRLGQAYQALETVSGARPEWTLYREVATSADGLPFDARRLFEVRIGGTPWTHELGARTFTIEGVTGHIRSIRVECEESDARLEYAAASEWTIPLSWGACTLHIAAKRGTTFALYEFD